MSYTSEYLNEVKKVVDGIDQTVIDKMVDLLIGIRESGGRLFFLGVGGGAGNASHAVNDFRKIAGIESYSPSDNVSELTARTNDEGWDTVFVEWLKGSRLNQKDGIFVFSVGGGDVERNISANLVRALEYAQSKGSRIMGIVGRDGGYTGKVGDACLIIPTVNQNTITTHTEAFQSVIWHLVVSHPNIQVSEMKWESTTE
ncbi:MAG: SIS domain-containing protein [Chloroflexi bacterium]|nr:SIS domain-containing protein [Chloroflexota bacterium]